MAKCRFNFRVMIVFLAFILGVTGYERQRYSYKKQKIYKPDKNRSWGKDKQWKYVNNNQQSQNSYPKSNRYYKENQSHKRNNYPPKNNKNRQISRSLPKVTKITKEKVEIKKETIKETIQKIAQENSKIDCIETQIQATQSQFIKIEQKIIHTITEAKQIISSFTQTPLRTNCSQKPLYDYNLLVLSWVPAECYGDKDCQKDWQTYQDLQSPTIHGFRPFGSSSYYENCFGEKGDPNCFHEAFMIDFDIDEALWNVSGLLYDVSQFWPANKFTHDEEEFYYQQWLNHGTCYLSNMIEDNPKAYNSDKAKFNRTIMIQYFKTAITKLKDLNIDVQPGKQFQFKQDFAADIGFKGKQMHFVLACDQNNQIMEIIFCYNRSKLPGKEVTIPCTFDDSCKEGQPIKLKNPL